MTLPRVFVAFIVVFPGSLHFETFVYCILCDCFRRILLVWRFGPWWCTIIYIAYHCTKRKLNWILSVLFNSCRYRNMIVLFSNLNWFYKAELLLHQFLHPRNIDGTTICVRDTSITPRRFYLLIDKKKGKITVYINNYTVSVISYDKQCSSDLARWRNG